MKSKRQLKSCSTTGLQEGREDLFVHSVLESGLRYISRLDLG